MRALPFLLLACASCLRAQPAAPTDTVITCDGPMVTSSTETDTTATFRGNVVVTGTDLKLDCDLLTVVSARSGAASATLDTQQTNIKSMVATGHVRIVQADRIATCPRAEVFPAQNRIVLYDHPTLQFVGDKSVVTAERMTFLRGQRQAIFDGPVKGIMPPLKDLGFNRPGSPGSAAPAPASSSP